VSDFASLPAKRRREQRYVMATDAPPNDRTVVIGDQYVEHRFLESLESFHDF
jgi:hypothetical protein